MQAQTAATVNALQRAGVAGTVVNVGGQVAVYSGDDAAQCAAATDGILKASAVMPCRVCCSAHYTGDAGQDTGRFDRDTGHVTVAIDTNGDADTVRAGLELVGASNVFDAVGVYGGDALPSIVADVKVANLPTLHRALRAHLKGFGCFAILA